MLSNQCQTFNEHTTSKRVSYLMRKELLEIQRHALSSLLISFGLIFVAFLVYTAFPALRDRSVVDTSSFEETLLILVILQGLFSIGSRKPWILFPFVVCFAMSAGYLSSFEYSGPWSLQYLRRQHMNQIVHLKMTMAAIVPALNALACHFYIERQKKQGK